MNHFCGVMNPTVEVLASRWRNERRIIGVRVEFLRKKLRLDRREAADIIGGSVNAFSRFENGKTKPPLALVKLLKVLDRHPELLKEVRAS